MENIKQKNQDITGGRRLRTSVWPLLLICIGVVWLLSNFGILSSANIIALLQLWPLLLIVGGLELLLGRSSPQLARKLGIGTLGFALAFMLVAPVFGVGKVDVKTDHFTEPLSGAVTANVTVSPSIGKTTISAAEDSNNLFDANVTYTGKLNYSHGGDKDKSITLKEDTNGSNFGVWNLWGNHTDLHWDVTLSPTVPINLSLTNGIGESVLDLSKLKLTGLDVDSGVGQVTLNLPPTTNSPYKATIKAGVGAVKATLPTDSDINLGINGGTGSVEITVPAGTAIQVIVNSGLGKANFGSDLNLTRVDGRGKDSDGTYETPNFASATHKIMINFDGGIGNFSIHS